MGICLTCGGINGFSVIRIVDLINKDAPHPWAIACPGHAEPESKHDGKLDGDESFTVYYDDVWSDAHDNDIEGIHILHRNSSYEHVTFTPEQALSLLAWLQQEKPTLEKMAGVEKDEAKGETLPDV